LRALILHLSSSLVISVSSSCNQFNLSTQISKSQIITYRVSSILQVIDFTLSLVRKEILL
jgi:hypothetical protein